MCPESKMTEWENLIKRLTVDAANNLQDLLNTKTETIDQISARVGNEIEQLVEKSLKETGKTVSEIGKNPVLQSLTNLFGTSWLKTILGEVDVASLQQDIVQLQQKYPHETPNQIAHRVILQKAIQGAGVGVVTNIIPPIAILLFAVDIGAVTALQAQMVYEIAAAYEMDLNDPTRRGEVLAMFGLSLGGSSALKVGLGILEIIPGAGMAIGASSNAILLYVLGNAASRFYETKLKVD